MRIPLGQKLTDPNYNPANVLQPPEIVRNGAAFVGGIAIGAGNVVSEWFNAGYDLGQYGVSSVYDVVTGETTHNEYLSAIGKARADGNSWGGIALNALKATLQTPSRLYNAASNREFHTLGEETFNLASILYPVGKGAVGIANKIELVDVPQRFGQAGGIGIRLKGESANGDGSIIRGVDPSNLNRSHEITGRSSSRKVSDIAESMRQSGYDGPPIDVVIQNERYYIVDGHHRAAAARRTGTPVDIRVIENIETHPSSYRSIEEVVRDSHYVGRDKLNRPGRK